MAPLKCKMTEVANFIVLLTDNFFFSLLLSSLIQQKGSRSDNNKSNKIFVGGIPHNCGETELREYFKKFGVVSDWAARCFPPTAFAQVLSSCQILG